MMRVSKVYIVLLAVAVLLAGCGPAEETADTPDANAQDTVEKGKLENGDWTFMNEGRQVHYAIAGEGPPCIVLTNAWGLNHTPLKQMFSSLEDTLTLIYFDPRGMGESSEVVEDSDMSMAAVREDAVALLDHLDIEKAYVMGWSNGAANTYMFCGEYPDRVIGGIALHSVEKMTEEDEKYMMDASSPMMEIYARYMQEMSDPDISDEEKEQIHHNTWMEWFPLMLADREKNEARLKEIFAPAEYSFKHAAYSNMVDSPAMDATEMLQKTTAPMLIIAGSADMLPPSSVQRAADLVENSTFIVFENSGHFAPIEEPELFKQAIVEFVK